LTTTIIGTVVQRRGHHEAVAVGGDIRVPIVDPDRRIQPCPKELLRLAMFESRLPANERRMLETGR
jgi:hypothetical protein